MLLGAGRLGLVLPIDVQQKEEAEGDDGEQGLEQAPRHCHQALPEAVEAREGEEAETRVGKGGGAEKEEEMEKWIWALYVRA